MLNKFKYIPLVNKFNSMNILIAASCYFNNIFITDFFKVSFFYCILSGVVMGFLVFRLSSLYKMILTVVKFTLN